MDYVRFVESLVAIHVATLETQIQSIRFFSQRQFPAALAHQTKVLAEALLRSLETVELQFIEEIESECEGLLGKFVEFTGILQTVGDTMDPATGGPRRIAEIAKKGRRSLTSTLSEEEIRLTSDVTERFKKMKGRVAALIKQIDSL